MGKKPAPKTALANALNTGAAIKAPVKKEEPVVKAPPSAKPKPKPVVEEQKTKKQLEQEQQRHLEEIERQRAQFYVDEVATKVREPKAADVSVTHVEDKDSRKPKAIDDLSDFWKVDLGILPFMPSDNVGMAEELPPEFDPDQRMAFLELFCKQLKQLLSMKFHIFWSQVMYDEQLRKALDSYLRFCLRSHDVARSQGETGEHVLGAEEGTLATDISRAALAVFWRLSRPEETAHEFITPKKFGEIILEHRIFDIPKLIDICAIYGDSNSNTVLRIVQSVFKHQPRFKVEFEKAVVFHMLGGLHQCCAPLQLAGSGSRPQSQELGIDECLTFLPDVLSCFNAVFHFFPEDCVEMLVCGSLVVKSSSSEVPLDELMVNLFTSVLALEKRGGKTSLQDIKGLFRTIRMLLCRLLSSVLGFQMAPKRGAEAFDKLLEWCRNQEDRTDLLHDLAKYGLDNVAIEWHASGLVDDVRMKFLEEMCGPMLPADALTAKQRHARAAVAKAAATPSASSGQQAAGSSAPASNSGGAASDSAKVREVREIVGSKFGEGFILQCLLHYGFSVPSVINAILDGSLPPQLETLPHGLKFGEAPPAKESKTSGLSMDDKRRIADQAARMDREEVDRSAKVAEARAAKQVVVRDEYDDDADDAEGLGLPTVRVASGQNDDYNDKEEGGSDNESSDEGGANGWGPDRGKGGKVKGGKGKGGGKGNKGPVQGQTVEARRKEANKSRVGNHNRKDAGMKKMAFAQKG